MTKNERKKEERKTWRKEGDNFVAIVPTLSRHVNVCGQQLVFLEP
jgi:hypothetical protein